MRLEGEIEGGWEREGGRETGKEGERNLADFRKKKTKVRSFRNSTGQHTVTRKPVANSLRVIARMHFPGPHIEEGHQNF